MDEQAHAARAARLALLANRYNELGHELEAEIEPAAWARLEAEMLACVSRIAREMGYAPTDLLASQAIIDTLNEPATFHRWKELLATRQPDADGA